MRKIKETIKKVQNIIIYFKENNRVMKEAGIKLNKSTKIDSVKVDKRKVNIYHIPNMHVLGALYGCALYTGVRHQIIVDDYYMNSSDNLKQFILNHECGHILHKDYSKDFLKTLITQLRAIANGTIQDIAQNTDSLRMWEKEVEADKHAADTIGTNNAIVALKELYTAVPQKEIADRIVALGGEAPENPFNSLFSNVIIDSVTTISLDALDAI